MVVAASAGQDSGHRCEASTSLTERLGDTFAGTGALSGYTTNNADALTDVGRDDGRYRALVTDNDQNQTLHFNEAQGRLDAKLVEFPFDVVVRNIGVGTPEDSQVAPPATGNPFVFAGVQVHVTDLDDPNSAHVVVGHRGGTHFTIEGKNTLNGDSSVNDAGAHVAPSGRADIRIVGNADRTLTVYWQTPGAGSATDSWTLYNGTGELPGPQAEFGNTAYIGLITYAFHSTGLPFVGTARRRSRRTEPSLSGWEGGDAPTQPLINSAAGRLRTRDLHQQKLARLAFDGHIGDRRGVRLHEAAVGLDRDEPAARAVEVGCIDDAAGLAVGIDDVGHRPPGPLVEAVLPDLGIVGVFLHHQALAAGVDVVGLVNGTNTWVQVRRHRRDGQAVHDCRVVVLKTILRIRPLSAKPSAAIRAVHASVCGVGLNP